MTRPSIDVIRMKVRQFLLKSNVFSLGKGSNNQNGNLRWHLPGRGGGSRPVSSATYLF